jgi:hypothetical protein
MMNVIKLRRWKTSSLSEPSTLSLSNLTFGTSIGGRSSFQKQGFNNFPMAVPKIKAKQFKSIESFQIYLLEFVILVLWQDCWTTLKLPGSSATLSRFEDLGQ